MQACRRCWGEKGRLGGIKLEAWYGLGWGVSLACSMFVVVFRIFCLKFRFVGVFDCEQRTKGIFVCSWKLEVVYVVSHE